MRLSGASCSAGGSLPLKGAYIENGMQNFGDIGSRSFHWVLRMMQMPLKSYGGPLPVLTLGQSELRDRLLSSVKYLTVEIGERNVAKPGSLQRTADEHEGIRARLAYDVTQISYQIGTQRVTNIEAILPGRDNDPASNIVVGAHYDSVEGTVGANDNATGVAATLELARLLRGKKLSTSVRFVLFVNEEPRVLPNREHGQHSVRKAPSATGCPSLSYDLPRNNRLLF